MAGTGESYRGALRTTLRSTAAAYGYALTIGTTSAVLTTVRGKPDEADLFLFIAGGLVAFALLEAALLASGDRDDSGPDHAFPFAGALNFLAVAAGLGAASGLAHAVHSAVAWLVAPLAATAVYLLLVAVQVTLVGSLRR
jgi:hypothetical protein